MTPSLSESLRAVREAGGRAFVPYVTGGAPGVDLSLLRRLASLGPDAIEVGLPFSDPVMDGPVIQEASRRALEAGTRPGSVLEAIHQAELSTPVVLMTYLNPVLARGMGRFVGDAVAAGASAAIVPDLPVDEAGEWVAACREAGLATVFLAAPNSGPERLRSIAAASDGFVYCVSSYGVTGPRERLAGTAEGLVRALRPITERPLLVGVGVSTTAQVREACRFADGVVVGSALMAPLLRGEVDAMLDVAGGLRAAARS